MAFNKHCDYCGGLIGKERGQDICTNCGCLYESETTEQVVKTNCKESNFKALYESGLNLLGEVILKLLRLNDLNIDESIKRFYPFIKLSLEQGFYRLSVEKSFDQEYLVDFISLICDNDYSFVKKSDITSCEQDVDLLLTSFNLDLLERKELMPFFSPYLLCFSIPSKDRALIATTLAEQGVSTQLTRLDDLFEQDFFSLNLSLENLLKVAKGFGIREVKSCLSGWTKAVKDYNKIVEVKH